MFFIVGLGNPGKEYQNTRHNVGWLLLDEWVRVRKMEEWQLKRKWQAEIVKDNQLVCVKPQTYMNRSGDATMQVISFFAKDNIKQNPDEFKNLVVVHDDLDIEFGKWKMQFGSGPKIHNGVNSIRQTLGHDRFWYVRIGIDGRGGERVIAGKDYVLQTFTTTEKQSLYSQLFPVIIQQLESTIL